ncbi:MAG: ATP-binding cassette domain-containing protein [Deltaproteobacteria bacterium]|nr:ATP-binding cassette domain-containing protein [Deltaproteobacteria bacterium]
MIRFVNATYTYPFQEKPAVRGVDLHVRPGELVLVTGESGCGKSTLLRLANGLCPQYFGGTLEGDVFVGGKSTEEMPLKDMSRMVGTLFQDPEQQFFALEVEDELAFVHEWRGTPAAETRRKIAEAAKEFLLEDLLGHSIHELSEGQKQKVGLASIFSQEPGALVLDEPTANLDPESTVELACRLSRLKKSGMAILVVDHRLYWLEDVADRVAVMREGVIVAQGAFDMLHDGSLRSAYGLRASHVEDVRSTLPESAPPTKSPCAGEKGLRVDGLRFAYKGQDPLYDRASFWLGQGVTALIGGNGTGKTTLARLITGLNKAQEGAFRINGILFPASEMLRHVGIVLQNSDHQLHMRTVAQEIDVCLALAERLRGWSKSRRSREEQRHSLLRLFDLEHLADRHPQSLSGGEKQRLVIACAFAKKPSILILDEPTSGLDGGNMKRIAKALSLLAEQGACVLVITHDLELLQASCGAAIRLPLNGH